MVKVISFSLWGDKSQYTIGSIRNAELAKDLYPDFECWFYIHKESVPKNIVNELLQISNVKIIFKYGDINLSRPMMWRFEAIDDPKVEVMLSRDTDTRIWNREVIAVNEWLQSDKIFHIMRDHPHHDFKILGGMFGTKKINNFNWLEKMILIYQYGDRMYDQDFLKEIIYPLVIDNCLIHASFHRYEEHSKPFSTSFNENYNFVGEYVYADDSRSLPHINILKSSL